MRIFITAVVAVIFASTVALAQTTPPSGATAGGSNTQTTTTPPAASNSPAQAPTGYSAGTVQSQAILPSAGTAAATMNIQFPPAIVTASDGATAQIYGADLFTGAFAGSSPYAQPGYVIQPGDVVEIKTYGSVSMDLIVRVAADGTVFVPVVGPIKLAGTSRNSLNSTIQGQLSGIYTNLQVYADVAQPGAIGVYVTGMVNRPGRYLGLATDSALYYLDKAGGIDGLRGSFRRVIVRHKGGAVEVLDLYKFRLLGELDEAKFRDGDTITVAPAGPLVVVTGLVTNAYAFELATASGRPDAGARDGIAGAGAQIVDFAKPVRTVTSAYIHSFKGREPVAVYRDIRNFDTAWLGDGDHVEFRSDAVSRMISVTVTAQLGSPSVFVVPNDTKLSEVLAGVPIDGSMVEPTAVHLVRRSVQAQQKAALATSLLQLQKQAFTTQAISAEQATIQATQATFVEKFVALAAQVQPTGLVAVYRDGVFQDLLLQDGDQIVIPNKTDVVIVSGEVLAPGALAHREGATIRDYVNDSGGYTDQADTDRFVLQRLDGSARVAKESDVPKKGDVIMVVPEPPDTTFELVKDISALIFQTALSAATVLKL